MAACMREGKGRCALMQRKQVTTQSKQVTICPSAGWMRRRKRPYRWEPTASTHAGKGQPAEKTTFAEGAGKHVRTQQPRKRVQLLGPAPHDCLPLPHPLPSPPCRHKRPSRDATVLAAHVPLISCWALAPRPASLGSAAADSAMVELQEAVLTKTRLDCEGKSFVSKFFERRPTGGTWT